ncbi:hypothetical protein WA158_004479 [Blastocystis sp. Blastoise]
MMSNRKKVIYTSPAKPSRLRSRIGLDVSDQDQNPLTVAQKEMKNKKIDISERKIASKKKVHVNDLQIVANTFDDVSNHVFASLREHGKRIPESAIKIFIDEVKSDLEIYKKRQLMSSINQSREELFNIRKNKINLMEQISKEQPMLDKEKQNQQQIKEAGLFFTDFKQKISKKTFIFDRYTTVSSEMIDPAVFLKNLNTELRFSLSKQ